MQTAKKQTFINSIKIIFIICLFIIPFCVFGFASESYFENIVHEKGPFLQWHGDPSTSISIMWETNEAIDSKVYYSTQRDNLETNSVFLEECVNVHKIQIEGLQQNTEYYYKVSSISDTNFLGKDEIYKFRTAPDASQSFNLSIIGDTRTNQFFESSTMSRMRDSMEKYDQDFIIHTGDLWYTNVEESEEGVKSTQLNADRFFTNFASFTNKKTLMAAVGRNQYTVDNGLYRKYLSQPGEVQGTDFSFNYAGTHFTFFSSAYNDYTKGTDQTWLDLDYIIDERLSWLETDLSEAQLFDYRIMIIRCPIDSSEFFSSVQLNTRLRTILNENDVSCVFMSGNKCYEHWNVDGLDYFITGCSGIAPETYGMINENTKKIALESNFVNLEVSSDSLQIQARTFDDLLIEEVEIPISN